MDPQVCIVLLHAFLFVEFAGYARDRLQQMELQRRRVIWHKKNADFDSIQ